MNKIIHLLYLVSIISLLPNSCNNSSEPISNRFDLELITYSELTSTIDSSLFYYKYYDWDLALDTLKANILANKFVDDYNSISDMWFPQSSSHCKWGVNDNFVFISLAEPEPFLIEEGYELYISGFLNCWSEFRHYKIH